MKDFKSGWSAVRAACITAGVCEEGDNDDAVGAKLIGHLSTLTPEVADVVPEVDSGDGEDDGST